MHKYFLKHVKCILMPENRCGVLAFDSLLRGRTEMIEDRPINKLNLIEKSWGKEMSAEFLGDGGLSISDVG